MTGKRGRPVGWRKPKPETPSIGSGTKYTFPIVRDGNTRTSVTTLSVGAESFTEALKAAVQWSLAYSEMNGAIFWPLVKYRSIVNDVATYERRYVKRVDCNFAKLNCNHAWVESKDYGHWVSTMILEVA